MRIPDNLDLKLDIKIRQTIASNGSMPCLLTQAQIDNRYFGHKLAPLIWVEKINILIPKFLEIEANSCLHDVLELYFEEIAITGGQNHERESIKGIQHSH